MEGHLPREEQEGDPISPSQGRISKKNGIPETFPEIEEPDEEEIDPDFPEREIDLPDEDEIIEEEPDREFGEPDEEEFER